MAEMIPIEGWRQVLLHTPSLQDKTLHLERFSLMRLFAIISCFPNKTYSDTDLHRIIFAWPQREIIRLMCIKNKYLKNRKQTVQRTILAVNPLEKICVSVKIWITMQRNQRSVVVVGR